MRRYAGEPARCLPRGMQKAWRSSTGRGEESQGAFAGASFSCAPGKFAERSRPCAPTRGVLTFTLQYIIARNGDIPAAVTRHAETVAWARTSGFGQCAEQPRKLSGVPVPCESLLLQRWPQHYLGRDTDNRPVVYEQIASFVPDDFAKKANVTAEDMCNYYVKHLSLQCALLREASVQEGRLVSRLVHIFDASGVSMRSHLSACARDTFHRVAAAADAHFPETLGVLLIINAGGPFPALWAVGKTFVDERTRSKIEVFPSPQSGANFFAPGGWPARVRQLMGGAFPEMLYPNARIPAVKEPPWGMPLWKLLGYPGPVQPRVQLQPEAPASPVAPPTRKPAIKAAAAPSAQPQTAALPPTGKPRRNKDKADDRSSAPPPGAVSFESAQVLPPPRQAAAVAKPSVSQAPKAQATGGGGAASVASRTIWELAANQVAAAAAGGGDTRRSGANDGAHGQSTARWPLPGVAVVDDVTASAAREEEVDRWVEQCAGHAPPPPPSRPPSSLGGAPDTPLGKNRRDSSGSHARVVAREGKPSKGVAAGVGAGAGTRSAWHMDDSAFDSPSGRQTPSAAHLIGLSSNGALYDDTNAITAASLEHLVTPDAVWDAVVDVAHALDLFYPENEGNGADSGTSTARSGAVEAAIREAAADGWCCGICGKRFAHTDVALAQACEARHAVEMGLSSPGHVISSPSLRAKAMASVTASPVRSGSAQWDASPEKYNRSPVAAKPTWNGDEAASPWGPVVPLDVKAPRQEGSHLSNGSGAAGMGRVLTSADARARMGGGPQGRGCTVPVPQQCSIQ